MKNNLRVIFLLGTVGLCYSVDIKLAEEGPCFDSPPPTVEYDKEAFKNTSNVWYHHIWHKYYMYRVAADVTGKNFEDITDRDLKTSCLAFSSDSPSIITEAGGFGARRSYEIGPGDNDDSFKWKTYGKEDWDAESWVTKADKDYFVTVTCWTTNQKSFTVTALTRTLNNSVKKEILEHVKELGFEDKYTYEVDVNRCPESPLAVKYNFVYLVPSFPSSPLNYALGYYKK